MSADLSPAPHAALPTIVSELRPAEAKSHFALTVFKWYPLILTFGVALALTAGISMLLKPALPSATARILLKTGPDALPITGLPFSPARGGQEFLQTEAELLTSRMVLLPVARALRQERGESAGDRDLDADVSTLRSNLAVTLVPNTTMLQAKKYAATEAEAERVLAMIIDSYVDHHATSYSGSTGFATFFERETGTAAANLRDAEDRLHRWRDANNVVAAEEELVAQLGTVADFEAAFRRIEVDIEATRTNMEALTRDIATLPRESVTSREHMANPLIARLKADIATEEATLRDVSKGPLVERLRMDISAAETAMRDANQSPFVNKLKGDLVTVELALHDLRQRYNDEDRRVQEKLEQVGRLQQAIAAAERDAVKAADERLQNLRRELAEVQQETEQRARDKVAALRTQLAAAERERDVFGRETVAANPVREALNRDLLTARTRLATLSSQRDGVRTQLNEARATLAHLKDSRVDAERMSREVELAKAVYLQSNKRLDDARLTIGLRKQQLTNIAVIEPPRATAGGRSLKQAALVALLGGVVGLGLGVATALALDFFNWSLRTPEDIEFYLGVPALAAIPAVLDASRPPRAIPAPHDRLAPEMRDDHESDEHARDTRGRA
jgi:uncharacterized protein involved in exopolysaccharide biosynthesis